MESVYELVLISCYVERLIFLQGQRENVRGRKPLIISLMCLSCLWSHKWQLPIQFEERFWNIFFPKGNKLQHNNACQITCDSCHSFFWTSTNSSPSKFKLLVCVFRSSTQILTLLLHAPDCMALVSHDLLLSRRSILSLCLIVQVFNSVWLLHYVNELIS